MSTCSKHHTDEFKGASGLMEQSGKSVPIVAEEFGIKARTLYEWIASHKPKPVTGGIQNSYSVYLIQN
jgi:transposase-like protein